MPTEGNDRITFRIDDALLRQLEQQAAGKVSTYNPDKPLSPAEWLRDHLPYFLEGFRRDHATFDVLEASAIVDACNGWAIEPHSVPLLWAQVEDAIRHENLAEKWGIDGVALIGRLRTLSYSQTWFVCRAATCGYWDAYHASSDHKSALIASGLVRA